jgi:hypothetical protein
MSTQLAPFDTTLDPLRRSTVPSSSRLDVAILAISTSPLDDPGLFPSRRGSSSLAIYPPSLLPSSFTHSCRYRHPSSSTSNASASSLPLPTPRLPKPRQSFQSPDVEQTTPVAVAAPGSVVDDEEDEQIEVVDDEDDGGWGAGAQASEVNPAGGWEADVGQLASRSAGKGEVSRSLFITIHYYSSLNRGGQPIPFLSLSRMSLTSFSIRWASRQIRAQPIISIA